MNSGGGFLTDVEGLLFTFLMEKEIHTPVNLHFKVVKATLIKPSVTFQRSCVEMSTTVHWHWWSLSSPRLIQSQLLSSGCDLKKNWRFCLPKLFVRWVKMGNEMEYASMSIVHQYYMNVHDTATMHECPWQQQQCMNVHDSSNNAWMSLTPQQCMNVHDT